MEPRTRKLVMAWAPAVLYMALIWVLSSLTLRTHFPFEVPLRDKGIHFVEYAVLGFLVFHATLATWPRRPIVRTFLVAVLITIAWGVLDEMHQAFVPTRAAETLDLLADSVGAVTGVSLRFLLRRARLRVRGQAATT